jgi:hypothetical protein
VIYGITLVGWIFLIGAFSVLLKDSLMIIPGTWRAREKPKIDLESVKKTTFETHVLLENRHKFSGIENIFKETLPKMETG